MSIQAATSLYEVWLGQQLALRPEDLAFKHRQMASAVFPFFRATFYRWMQLWNKQDPEWSRVPTVLSVGDLHVENFGTWRDGEGRLIWGINDFDEAYPLPYTLDLVRLAASAALAIDENKMRLKPQDACEAILDGYSEGLQAGGQPYVLAEHHGWLRHAAMNDLREPCSFWEKLSNLPSTHEAPPPEAVSLLEAILPAGCQKYSLHNRVAGLGSLGRIRVVALSDWLGGKIAREVKSLAPSAAVWAAQEDDSQVHYDAIVKAAVRVPDPFLRLHPRWVARRLAPDCSRVELAKLSDPKDECKLLHAMGWETANVHLGSPSATIDVHQHLSNSKPGWLYSQASTMRNLVVDDWKSWRKGLAAAG